MDVAGHDALFVVGEHVESDLRDQERLGDGEDDAKAAAVGAVLGGARRALRRRHRHGGRRASQGEGQRHHGGPGRRERRALRAVLHPDEAGALAQHVGGRRRRGGAPADGMGRRARGRDRASERRPRGRALLLADAPLHGARVHGQGRLRQGRVPNALAPVERPNRQKARRGCDAKLLLHVPPWAPSRWAAA